MFDARLFSLINGLTGRYAWLDFLGRYLAVFGLLAILLIVLGVLWWPRWEPDVRRRYLIKLLLITASCLLIALVEMFFTRFIVHHELRSRPFNSRWATMLVTAETTLSFPAWPAVIAFAFIPPTWRIAKRAAWAMAILGVLLGFSLVFVGINFPVDVIIGCLLGVTLGFTCTLVLFERQRLSLDALIALIVLWSLLIVGSGAVALRIYQGSHTHIAKSQRLRETSVYVAPPATLLAALQQAASPGKLQLPMDRHHHLAVAATNGHLLAADIQSVLPDAKSSPTDLTAMAGKLTNTAFAGWPELRLVTITIYGTFTEHAHTRTATLCTATVAREEWPAGGFAPTQHLPGRVYISPVAVRNAPHHPPQPAVSSK